MCKPDLYHQDEDLVAVLAALEHFRGVLLPLVLTSTITLAGVMLTALT